MSKIGPVIVNIVKNNYRSKVASITLIVMTLGISLILVALGVYFFMLPELNAPVPDVDKVSNILGLIAYVACLCGMGLNINIFTAQPLIREKAQKTLESLLATPLTAKQIWVARSLAVFLPGLLIGEIFAISFFLIANFVFVVPTLGFLVSPWIIINGFVVIPALYFFVTLLVHLVALVGNPISGNAIAQSTLPAMGALLINLGVRHIWTTTSWIFTLVHGIALALFMFFILIHQSSVTKEKIVLSEK